ncbi:MAG: tRNA (adenosine(37)-N6)-dimethylallyltransferase MiaA [Cyclobacteriaceae bacterium]
MHGKKLIVIAGPTAVGKTSVAIHLAEYFRCSIISADSRQIYKELTIGTAKPSPAELARVPHYFINSHSIYDPYDAARYGDEALSKINELFLQTNRVILCGGSGLYIKAVCEGFDDIPEVPGEVRDEIMDQFDKQGIGWLQEKMQQLDPEAYKLLDPQNPHRLIRALEVRMYTGESIRTFRKNEKRKHAFDISWIGLEIARKELYARIDTRMGQMIQDGLFEEAAMLYPMRHHNALQTVGYQEIFDLTDNIIDRDECLRLLKRNTRRYAKRQLTWFKKNKEFTWFHPDDVQAMIDHIEITS